MKHPKLLAGILLAGIVIVLAALILASVEAGPAKVKIVLTCGETGEAANIWNSEGSISPGNCISDIGLSFTPFADIDVKINAAPASLVSIIIFDAKGNQKYKVTGNASSDTVTYYDAEGNDELVFTGEGGVNSLIIAEENGEGDDKYKAKDTSLSVTDGPGNDDYEGNQISSFSVTDGPGNDNYKGNQISSFSVTDGPGNDNYEGKNISSFMFTDSPNDKDNIAVKTG